MKAIFKAFFYCIRKWQDQVVRQVVVQVVRQVVRVVVRAERLAVRVVERVVVEAVESAVQVQFVELYAKKDVQAICHL